MMFGKPGQTRSGKIPQKDSTALRKQTAVEEQEELLAGKDHFLFVFAINN